MKRYTNTLSQLLGSVDELISTCLQMDTAGWDMNNQYFEEDKYIDWKNSSQKSLDKCKEETIIHPKAEKKSEKIQLELAVDNFILRKV